MAVKGVVFDTTIKQRCRDTVNGYLDQYFKDNLKREANIANLIMAIIQHESSFNVSSIGPEVPPEDSSLTFDFVNASAVARKAVFGSPEANKNIKECTRAWGLMQSMGCNHVIGGSAKSGKCLMESASLLLKQDFSKLYIKPGDSIRPLLLGDSTVSNQILAGMVVLAFKYVTVKTVSGGFTPGDGVLPSDRMQAAIRGYVGTGKVDNGNGSNPVTYVSTVYYGSAYKEANGPNAPIVQTRSATQVASGPNASSASGNNLHPVGC